MLPDAKPMIGDLVQRQSGLVKTQDGFAYRDLNKNEKLDIYEDPRQPLEARVEDLLGQMTLEEKAGTLFINGSIILEDGSLNEDPHGGPHQLVAKNQIDQHAMTHSNLLENPLYAFGFGLTY